MSDDPSARQPERNGEGEFSARQWIRDENDTRWLFVNYREDLPFGVSSCQTQAGKVVGILALLASIVFSFTPILHLSSTDTRDNLTEGGRGAAGTLWRRIGAQLVVIELATTMVLFTGAGLLGKSLYRLLHVDVGFQVDHLSPLHVRLPGDAFPGDREQVAFVRRLLRKRPEFPSGVGAP